MKNEDDKKVTLKSTFAEIWKKIKKLAKKVAKQIQAFSRREFGKVKGSYILFGATALVVVLLFLLIFGKNNKGIDYPVIFNNSEGELLSLTKNSNSNKAVKLSNSSLTYEVKYANTTTQYALFIKNSDLYLYNVKKKDETIKLCSKVDFYSFTENDNYIIMTDEDNNLYTYNFKGEKEKLESDITYIVDYNNDYILYAKDDTLYLKSLNYKKTERKTINAEFRSGNLSKDGKEVLYRNKDNELHIYTVKNGKDKTIASNVDGVAYGKNNFSKLYYNSYNDNNEYDLYFYDGKTNKIASDVDEIITYDVDRSIIIYVNSKEELYYQKGTKEAVKILDNYFNSSKVKLFKNSGIYYTNDKNELYYIKIKGAKLGKTTKLTDSVNSYLYPYKNGYAFIANTDSELKGTLYMANGSKIKRIDTDVYDGSIVVSNNGKRIYYLKNYSSLSGDLYYSNGSKPKKIDSNIYRFQYVKDDLIYYLKDYSSSKIKGDLYRYTGKKTKIAESVTSIAETPNTYELD